MRKVAVTPKTPKESTDKQQQQQEQHQRQQQQGRQRQQQQEHDEETPTPAATETESVTPSVTKPDEDLSVPKQLTSVDDADPPRQSTKDTSANVDSISLDNAGPTPSLGHPNTPQTEFPGKRTKPASSVAAAAGPPPLLLNVAEVDGEEDGEGSRSIGSMLKKLTVSVATLLCTYYYISTSCMSPCHCGLSLCHSTVLCVL